MVHDLKSVDSVQILSDVFINPSGVLCIDVGNRTMIDIVPRVVPLTLGGKTVMGLG